MKEELDYNAPVMKFTERVGDYEFTRFTTTRHGGISTGEYDSFNLSFTCGDKPGNVKHNRDILSRELGSTDGHEYFLYVPTQVHGDRIFDIDTDYFLNGWETQQEQLDGYDALISTVTDFPIAVTTADCVPVVFYDPVAHVIAVAHAGWRGTAKQIVSKVIASMIENHRCKVINIKATIFPCISRDMYEVGEDVIDAIDETPLELSDVVECCERPSGDVFYLDLATANRNLLLAAGILPENITMLNECTYTWSDDFFSARRQGIGCGRMLSGILMKNLREHEDENNLIF